MIARRLLTGGFLPILLAWAAAGHGGDAAPVAGLDPKEWMKGLSDDVSIGALSLPGTHESCARFGGDLSVCQWTTLQEQLDAGIRVLDIRCRPMAELTFTIHHGPVYQELTFGKGVRDVCEQFLSDHPSETIVMLVQPASHVSPGPGAEPFEVTFNAYVMFPHYRRWYLEEKVPTLKEARGRIVLVRRFPVDKTPLGIDATAWSQHENANPGFSIDGPGKLYVQDHFQIGTLADRLKDGSDVSMDKKYKLACSVIEECLNGTRPGYWYLNYSSATMGPLAPSPQLIAQQINPKLHNFLQSAPPGNVGTIMMDFPDNTDGLINSVLYRNLGERCWSGNQPIEAPDVAPQSDEGPASAASGRLISVAYKEPNSIALHHATLQSDRWSGGQAITVNGRKVESNKRPAIAYIGNELHMVHKGAHSDALYHSTYVNSAWSGNRPIKEVSQIGPESDEAPAVAAVGGKLVVVYKRKGTGVLYHAELEGSAWSGDAPAQDASRGAFLSDAAPAMASDGNKLYLVFKGKGTADLYQATYDGKNWSGNKPLKNLSRISPGSNDSPTMALVDGRFYLYYKGADNNVLYQAIHDASGWTGNVPLWQVSGISPQSNKPPAVVASGDYLHLFHKDAGSNRLCRSFVRIR